MSASPAAAGISASLMAGLTAPGFTGEGHCLSTPIFSSPAGVDEGDERPRLLAEHGVEMGGRLGLLVGPG
ncbi:MAG TPA: hypothetical protein VFG53_05155 [Anaeromyxobacter sp.]|nr:hypothetical protein [Anaeromyxobacter sp.]